MTTNQIAYQANLIKQQEADVKKREADIKQQKQMLEQSEHLHEYGSIWQPAKTAYQQTSGYDIGLKQFKDTTQGVKNIFSSAGDILGTIAKALIR